jgi:membrane-associated protein
MLNLIDLISFSGFFDVFTSGFVLADAADAAGGPGTLKWWIDLVLHADKNLQELVTKYGVWTHLILFAIVFCETGLVFTPFLPGDSLLFISGAFAGLGSLKIEWLIPSLIFAAVAGDTVNYWMGKWIGMRAFNGKVPFLKKEHLDKTHRYFEKYGAKTIIIARFVPIVRTFAPFVAGMGAMNYTKFLLYNVIGGVVWVLGFLLLGYAVGSHPWVKANFKLITIAIIGISVLPIAWEFLIHFAKKKKPVTEPAT